MNLLLDCVGRVNALLRRAIGALCAVVMTALTLVVLWGVFTRYVFGEQPAFTEEFARMFLICITFFGGALAFAEGAHIGLDYLVSKFSPQCRRASALAAYRAGPLAPPYMRRVWQAAACQTPPPSPGAIPAQASSAIPKTYECLK